jgi:ELWxxDGT repeat protein
VLFIATKSDGTKGLYMSTGGYPTLLKAFSAAKELTRLSGVVLFAADDGAGAGMEVWKSDGTAEGTILLADINEGASGSDPVAFKSSPDYLTVMFAASTGTAPTETQELYKMTSTTTTPVSVGDITDREFLRETERGGFRVFVGTKYFFFAGAGGVDNKELWVYDPQAQATAYRVKSFGGANADWLTAFQNKAFFAATDGSGMRLWSSDGTAGGTAIVDPQNQVLFPSWMIVFGNKLYFSGLTAAAGQELRSTDGQTISLVKDINPGAASSSPNSFVEFDGKLFFSALAPLTGEELWYSDGTFNGTSLHTDINNGVGFSSPRLLKKVGNRVIFVADNGTSGRELFLLE